MKIQQTALLLLFTYSVSTYANPQADLLHATAAGNQKQVEHALKAGASVNYRYPHFYNYTPLMHAILQLILATEHPKPPLSYKRTAHYFFGGLLSGLVGAGACLYALMTKEHTKDMETELALHCALPLCAISVLLSLYGSVRLFTHHLTSEPGYDYYAKQTQRNHIEIIQMLLDQPELDLAIQNDLKQTVVTLIESYKTTSVRPETALLLQDVALTIKDRIQ